MAPQVTHSLTDGILTLSIEEKELTYPVADACRTIINDAIADDVDKFVIDFHFAEHIDSTFIAALLVLNEQARKNETKVRLVGVGDRVGTVLHQVRIRVTFEEHETVESAVASFG